MARFKKIYTETKGVGFNFYYSKIREVWVAYSVDARFENKPILKVLEVVKNYLIEHREDLLNVRENYQFKYQYKKRKETDCGRN